MIRWALAIVIAMCVTTPAVAGGKFLVGVEDIRYYPQYSTNNGFYTGYGRTVLDGFAKSRGYEFEYIPLPVLRLYDRFFKTDELDFKYPDNPDWQRSMRPVKGIWYSERISEAYDGVMVLPLRKRMEVDQLLLLGTVRGFTATKYDHLISSGQVELVYTDDYLSLIKMVLQGRVDGGFGCLAVARYNLEHMERSPEALTLAPNLPYTRVAYRLSTRKHPEIIRELNEYLQTNKERLDLLLDRYGLGRRIRKP